MKRISSYLSFACLFALILTLGSCSRSTNSLSLSKKNDRYSIRENIFNKESAALKGEVKFIRESRPSISYDEHVVWGFIEVAQPSNRSSVPQNVVFNLSQKNASKYVEQISIYQTEDLELDATDIPVGKVKIQEGSKRAKVIFNAPINFKNGSAKLIVSLYLRSNIPADTKIKVSPKGFFYTKGRSIYSAKIGDAGKPAYVPLVYSKHTPIKGSGWNKPMYNVGFLKLDKKKSYRSSRIDPSEFSHVILSDFNIATDNTIFLASKGSFIVDQAELINSLHNKGVKVYMRLTAKVDNDNQQRLEYFTSLLSNEAHMKAFALELREMLVRNNIDGVNLNFQKFKETGLNSKEHLCRFIDVIHRTFDELGENRLELSANVTSSHRAWDYEELSKRTDFLTVMLYGFSRKFSSPLNVVKERVQAMKDNGIPTNKLVPIFPFYGNRWIVNKMNDRHLMLLGYMPMRLHKVFDKGEAKWHELEQCYTYDYKDDKDWIRVYVEDPRSIEAKLKYVKSQDLRGFGWFYIGNEARDQASIITSLFDKYNRR